jgi:glycosyltransferase involved in cell wall biosynthesis
MRAATLVFPIREDCLSVVTLEALDCAMPVVATSVVGIPDLIDDDVNGI